MMEKYEAYLRRKALHTTEDSDQEQDVRPKAAADPDLNQADNAGGRDVSGLRHALRLKHLRRAREEAEESADTEARDGFEPVTGLTPEDVAASDPGPIPAPLSRRPAKTVPRRTESSADAPRMSQARSDDPWNELAEITLDTRHLMRQRVISAARHDPAHVAFDVLRTRLLSALRERGWKRVAITSPTKDCGKTFVATNLGMSLSRQSGCRTILLDMDLRRPSMAKVLGVKQPGTLAEVLTGDRAMGDHLLVPAANEYRIGDNLAFGLNGRPESYASELLQGPTTPAVLSGMIDTYSPDVVLYDMPPALYYDDVIAFREEYDGVLLVVGGGITKPQDVRDVKNRLGEETPLLGVIMNKAEGLSIADYSY